MIPLSVLPLASGAALIAVSATIGSLHRHFPPLVIGVLLLVAGLILWALGV